MFKKIAIAAGVVLAAGLFAADVAQASDGYRGRSSHGRLHDNLDHNEFHRELYHRDAHRYPMSPRSHGRLHDSLDHDRFHDSLQHRQYHRSYRYPSYRSGYGSQHHGFYRAPQHYGHGGFGIGISPSGFSLRLGR